MSAAAFIFHYSRLNIKEIKQTQAVCQDIIGLNTEKLSEKNIVVRRTTAKKQGFTFRIKADIFRQIVPAICFKLRRCHRPHQRMKKAPVRLMRVHTPECAIVTDIPNKFRKIHSRGTSVVTKPAGKTGPNIILD